MVGPTTPDQCGQNTVHVTTHRTHHVCCLVVEHHGLSPRGRHQCGVDLHSAVDVLSESVLGLNCHIDEVIVSLQLLGSRQGHLKLW